MWLNPLSYVFACCAIFWQHSGPRFRLYGLRGGGSSLQLVAETLTREWRTPAFSTSMSKHDAQSLPIGQRLRTTVFQASSGSVIVDDHSTLALRARTSHCLHLERDAAAARVWRRDGDRLSARNDLATCRAFPRLLRKRSARPPISAGAPSSLRTSSSSVLKM
jgi:hypothetical protein